MKEQIKKIVGPGALKAYHMGKSHVASLLYGRPASDMTVIGVTGTNGKTTTCNLIAAIFEQALYKVALCTTIQYRIMGEEVANVSKMTAPDPFTLNAFIAQAKKQGCNVLVIEVTSHGLDQERFAGISFDIGVLTNITHDHLDYHQTFDHYVQAKRKLFARGLRLAVLNYDDQNGRELVNTPADVHILYSTLSNTAVHPHTIRHVDDQTSFDVVFPDTGFTLPITTYLPGQFNISNILAAVCVGVMWGVEQKTISDAITSVKSIPGRMDKVDVGQPFTVLIDYAHTPDAFTKLYEAIVPLAKGHHIISVFGATGDRDKTKRPILGSIAAEHAHFIVVTNEDPYTEDPQAIIDQVAAGVRDVGKHSEGKSFWRMIDRKAAILHAIRLAKPGDIVTVTGKGAEVAMVWGSEHRPWSDRAIILECLDEAGYGTQASTDSSL